MTGCEIVNDADMERSADALLERGTHCVVVSMGQRGCYWADRSGARFYAALRPVSRMVDATGAGDVTMADFYMPTCFASISCGGAQAGGGDHCRYQRRYRQSGDERRTHQ